MTLAETKSWIALANTSHPTQGSSCLPREGDRDSDSRAEAHKPPAALADGLEAGQRRPAAHPGEERHRGFLTLLEAAQQ